ncbi:hypothetical protein [Calothrix sp. 336/3]|uniref:hypothetical protein n=1 Tax=Calothrix sp. 336/3 TaxID=1337936 RepID=UPI0004E2B4B1|nr:hypothetical protein [Calothrix sp. 336/3]AKG22854.1 PatU [Calothrix sp. 336/3]
MNSDSESLQHQLLTWLLADNANTEGKDLGESKENHEVQNPEVAKLTSDFQPETKPLTFQLGEIPTVQERFQAVLKRRLQVQIQSQPPLFPWETEFTDYPDYLDSPSVSLVPTWGWAAQLSQMNLPIPLPEKVFQQLLEKCQALVNSSLPLGAKLVQAVESFFPEETQAVNDVAGLVLRSPSRSVAALEMPSLDSDYADLQPRQQMALSLIAAKQLLENLTLSVSATNPTLVREWVTDTGVVKIQVEYQAQGNFGTLRVQGDLPVAGVMKLQGNRSEVAAESSDVGSLRLELYPVQLHQTYTLAVELKSIDQQPLLFVITPTL